MNCGSYQDRWNQIKTSQAFIDCSADVQTAGRHQGIAWTKLFSSLTISSEYLSCALGSGKNIWCDSAHGRQSLKSLRSLSSKEPSPWHHFCSVSSMFRIFCKAVCEQRMMKWFPWAILHHPAFFPFILLKSARTRTTL